MDRRLRLLTALLVVLAGLGCATPIGVRRVDESAVQRTLTADALSAGEPSVASRQVLLRLGLSEAFARDPEAALVELLARTLEEMHPDRLFALAEYSFLYAQETGDRNYFVATSIYAYAYLFPGDGSPHPNPLDPGLRTAVDLYNRSLARALVNDKGEVAVEEGSFLFHLGSLELEIDPDGFRWAGRRLSNFVPAAELEVRGLRNRYRRPGMGAPFLADAIREADSALDLETAHIPERLAIPVTAFLRYRDARTGLRTGRIHATLEVYTQDSATETRVNGRQVPLEYETSSALAYNLGRSRIWDFEVAGFLRSEELPVDDQLIMLQPYRPGRIPIVLVHGTASSPGRWGELLNELQSDPRIHRRYQVWLFLYSTGNPVLYSASLLRDSLRDTVAALDPEGRDPALRRMVVIGHSQGGLLTKLQVTTSGDLFWRNVTDEPFDEVDLAPETRALIATAGFFEPLPFVERVIFIATPHRGSFVAASWLGRIASNLFTAPENLVGTTRDLARATVDSARKSVDRIQGDDDSLARREFGRVRSSVDNMKPSDPFTVTLSSIPVAAGVAAHSIIPVTGGSPAEGQNDGVVEYESAHIDEAVSEYVVYHSEHSTQADPRTIQEVRRILLEHLDASLPRRPR